MRRPNRQVELDDIISSEILGNDPEVIASVMRIHLALEAILIELISTFRTDDNIFRLSFPAKTELLEKQGLISANDRAAYDRLNNFRNDFAHIFGHQVAVLDVLALARDLEGDGVDFSDSVGHYSPVQAVEYYDGVLGILAEVGWCILSHAANSLSENGGRDIFQNQVE